MKRRGIEGRGRKWKRKVEMREERKRGIWRKKGGEGRGVGGGGCG